VEIARGWRAVQRREFEKCCASIRLSAYPDLDLGCGLCLRLKLSIGTATFSWQGNAQFGSLHKLAGSKSKMTNITGLGPNVAVWWGTYYE